MLTRILPAIVAVFIAWAVLDMVIHGVLLQEAYAETAALWRPVQEMKVTLMYAVTLAYAAGFVLLYELFVADKSVNNGVAFGTLFGLATGVAMGPGSYAFLPIPLSLALAWLAAAVVEAAAAGLLVGLIVKPRPR